LVIVVNNAAEYVAAFYRTCLLNTINRYGAALFYTLMRAALVIVAHILAHHTPQMTVS